MEAARYPEAEAGIRRETILVSGNRQIGCREVLEDIVKVQVREKDKNCSKMHFISRKESRNRQSPMEAVLLKIKGLGVIRVDT